MYLEQKTKENYGYTLEDLTPKSRKPILVQCDYCGLEFKTHKKNRAIAFETIETDCCKKCKYIKMKETNKIKYGAENVFQLEETKEKMKETCLEKYGVEIITQSDQMKEKSKQTMLERYGSEYATQVPELQEKAKKTNLEKYGVESPAKSEEIKEKIKQTQFDKYGGYFVNTDACRQIVKDKYGVDNVFQLDEVKEKSKQTMLEKYGVEYASQVEEFKERRIEAWKNNMIASGKMKIHKGKSIAEWSEELGFSRSYFNALVSQYGWEVAINKEKRITNIELFFKLYLEDLGLDFKYNQKLGKYYPDFLVDDLIIEACGLFYHGELIQKNNSYHFNKKKTYTKDGYRSLFFWEDEILNKPEIVKSITGNQLGLSKQFYARKLKVIKIGKTLANKFFNKNHLMGRGAGDTYALTNGTSILSAMRLRRRKENHWEISRFCHRMGHSVVGGFSKLLKYFEKTDNPNSIITFIDQRYGTGGYLSDFGFSQYSNYKSFRWTDGHETWHRMKFPSNSGYDHGLAKIWDCGQAKYIKNH